MTRFSVGQRVVASASVQGLSANNSYTVVGVEVQSLPFGDFVTYLLQNSDGPVIPVVNGHLLLDEAPGGGK